MKTCLNCYYLVDDDAKVCPHCGQDFSEYNQCPNCGRNYLGFSYMCSYCGHPLYNNEIHPTKKSDQKESQQTVDSQPPIEADVDKDVVITENPADVVEESEEVVEESAEAAEDSSGVVEVQEEAAEEPSEVVDGPEEDDPKEHEQEDDEPVQDEEDELEKSTIERSEDEAVEVIEDADDEPVIILDDEKEVASRDETVTPPAPAVPEKKQYSRRHVSDKIGKKEDHPVKSKVLNLANETEDLDADEEEEKKERRFSKWLHWFLFLFFLAIIAAGVGAFLYYDNLVSRKKEAEERAVRDSLFNQEKAKQEKAKAERAEEDSLLNLQISALHETDSLNKVRQNEFRRLDSIRVDTFMTRVITDVCPSNQILARQLDGQNYIYYYTDLSSPIFKLYGFDGVKKETFTIIDDIQAQLVGSFVTPDRRNLIILCKDEKHGFGLAYKYNMYESTLADYESMDKDENKCYDVGTTSDGFFMKFGKEENKTFQSLYTSYFDKYGNFITQQ